MVRDRGRRFFDEAGRAERVLAVVQDVSRESRLESELAKAANALALALEGLVVLDGEGRYVVLLTDISRLEETSRQVAWTATHDDLTGLLTRAPFLEATADALDEASRYERTPTVLFLDLDGFKAINDRDGHAAGDAVLRAVADALRALLREDDTVSRWGGDEFAVLLRSVGVVGAMRVAENIVASCADTSQDVRVSVGVAQYPDHGATAEALLQAADGAMYRAKAAGGGCARLAVRPE